MSEPNNDKLNKKMGRIVYLTMFSSYFFRLFGPLFWMGIAFLIAGIFVRQLLIIGGALLLLDLIVTLVFMRRFMNMQSENPEFERLRQALNNGVPADELEKMTGEWEGNGFYTARIDGFREEASSCKTVEEAFGIYKKYCLAVVTGQETYTVTLGLDKKYFADDGRYSVISFDRMRIISDDVECHMFFDLLYDPDEIKLPKNKFSSEGIASPNIKEFFDKVEEYLKDNDLMKLPIVKTNIGTDE
ncbi:MAG: hypothetical protein J5778_10780 [Clostridiales bacterium]|nr:hypothetical protein [Clostridiales bacterium]